MPRLLRLPENVDWRRVMDFFDDGTFVEEIRFGRMGEQDEWYVDIRFHGLEYIRRLDEPEFAQMLVDILDGPR